MKRLLGLLSVILILTLSGCTAWNWNDPTPKPNPANHCTWRLVKYHYYVADFHTWISQDRWECVPNSGGGWN